MTKVMDLFEDGGLKDQKLIKKQLISAPEVKQHHLQPLCWLPESVQESLLDSVLNEREEANEYRQLELMKKAFVKCTNSRSWEYAESTYPSFVSNLDKFVTLKFSKHDEIPEVFKTFCQAAINSKKCANSSQIKKIGDFHITLVQGNMESVSMEQIKKVDDLYAGAQFILTSVPKVCSIHYRHNMVCCVITRVGGATCSGPHARRGPKHNYYTAKTKFSL